MYDITSWLVLALLSCAWLSQLNQHIYVIEACYSLAWEWSCDLRVLCRWVIDKVLAHKIIILVVCVVKLAIERCISGLLVCLRWGIYNLLVTAVVTTRQTYLEPHLMSNTSSKLLMYAKTEFTVYCYLLIYLILESNPCHDG